MVIHTPRGNSTIIKKPIEKKKEEVKETVPKKIVKKKKVAAPVEPIVEPETAELDKLDDFSEWDFND